MSVRIAGMLDDSIVDGPGLRFVVFAQGCRFGCPGCHNPESQPFDGGTELDAGDIIARMKKNPLTDGLTLSGGEPFLQADGLAAVAEAAREAGLNVWIYTGYTFEELMSASGSIPGLERLLLCADVLVDGRFIEAQKSLDIPFRGSRNQRILDVRASMEAGRAVLWRAGDGSL